jgi:hypothetical protein
MISLKNGTSDLKSSRKGQVKSFRCPYVWFGGCDIIVLTKLELEFCFSK